MQNKQNVGCRSRLGCFLRALLFVAIGIGIGSFAVSHGLSCDQVRADDYSASHDYALCFDGNHDWLDCGTMGDFGTKIAAGGFGFYIKTETTATSYICGTINDGSNTYLTIMLNHASYGGFEGVRLWLRDEDSRALAGYAVCTGLCDGEWHFLQISWFDWLNNIFIYLDGEPQSVTYVAQQAPNNFASFQYPFTWGAANGGGGVTGGFTGNLDELWFYIYSGEGAEWTLDEGEGYVAVNRYSESTNSYHAFVVDAEWVEGVNYEPPEQSCEELLIEWLADHNYTTLDDVLSLNFTDMEGIKTWLAGQNYTTLQSITLWLESHNYTTTDDVETWAELNNVVMGGIGMPLWYLFGLAALAVGAWWSRSMMVNIMVIAMAGGGFPLAESTLEAGTALYWAIYLVLILAVIYSLIQFFTRVEHW